MKLQTPDGRTYITDSEVEVAQLVGTRGYKLVEPPKPKPAPTPKKATTPRPRASRAKAEPEAPAEPQAPATDESKE